MGLLKKKKVVVPKAPKMSFEVAMSNTTTLTADETGEYCHVLFQTAEAVSAADWESLAQFARKNARFVISVLDDGEGKNDD